MAIPRPRERLPAARVQRRGEAAGFYFEERTGQVKLRGAKLHGLDLREAGSTICGLDIKRRLEQACAGRQ